MTVLGAAQDLSTAGATEHVVALIRETSRIALSGHVAQAARRCFLNWMACALGAIHEPSVKQVSRVALNLSGRSDSSLVGRRESVDPVNAALVNGVAANALDFDDMHGPTLIHPTGPVVAAALALAESRHATGDLLLSAIVAGIEVECRLGRTLFPTHYDAGWHITATLGTFGAVAAAAVVLDLDAKRTRHALGMACTLAGGVRAMLNSSCKSLNIGKAAAAGVSAALLAEADLDSEPDALEAKFGFFHTFGQPCDPSALVRDPDDRLLVEEVSLKPYPCGIVIHPLIDACIALAKPDDLRAGDVRSVKAFVHPRALELANRPRPATALEGRYSLQHAAALAFVRGSAGLSDFDDARVDDPDLVSWRNLIELGTSPGAGPEEARVIVERTDGERLEHRVRHPSGSPQRPLDEAQLHRKFIELASRALDETAAERLYRNCLGVDRLSDANDLRRHWNA